MDVLDILKIFKREKEVSTIILEKPDIIYQVWELGRVIGEILEVCWIIKRPLLEKVKEEGFLIENAVSSFRTLETLYKNLSVELKTLGWVEDLSKKIVESINKICLKEFDSYQIQQNIEEWQKIIQSELRSRTIHLCHLFLLALNLKKLVTKLLYDIESEEIESLIKENIELVERIKKGDKILISPNLEISGQNLKIIKTRLKGFKKHISDLRYYSKKEILKFIPRLVERTNLWTELIMDIKNPSDYLRFQKLINTIIPVLICYYVMLIGINLLIAFIDPEITVSDIFKDLPKYIKEIPQNINKNTSVIFNNFSVIFPLFIILLYFLVWVYRKIKEGLIIWNFRFKIYQFTSHSIPIYCILRLGNKIKEIWRFINKVIIIKPSYYVLLLKRNIREFWEYMRQIIRIKEELKPKGMEILGIKDVKERKKIPLFHSLSEEDFKKITSKLKARNFKKGELIIQEGKKMDFFYILKSGQVDVMVKENKIAQINKKWDFFGEISLLSGGERTATLKAVNNVETACLDHEGFSEILKESPSIASNLTKILVLRISELIQK